MNYLRTSRCNFSCIYLKIVSLKLSTPPYVYDYICSDYKNNELMNLFISNSDNKSNLKNLSFNGHYSSHPGQEWSEVQWKWSFPRRVMTWERDALWGCESTQTSPVSSYECRTILKKIDSINWEVSRCSDFRLRTQVETLQCQIFSS